MAKIVDDRAAELERENAELRRQLDICHAELSEALAQQTATAEVLQVINSSPGDLAPVFDAILENARAVCGFAHGSLNVYDGEYFRTVATHGIPEAFAEILSQPRRSGPQARFLQGDRVVHILDAAADLDRDDPVSCAAVELGGVRTVLFVPLRSDRSLLGYFTASRREVRAFTEKEVTLLENFAAQAVIAMENARLLTETREALEQQTATAEVLQVINSSPGDLAPVFDAMLEKAMRLCDAAFGQLAVYEDGRFHTAATRGMPGAFVEYRRSNPPDYGPGTQPARLLAGERIIHIADMMAEDVYKNGDPNRRALVDLGGVRTSLMVPLLRDDAVLGFINFYRREVRPFSDKQIGLLQNFAAQAVIAMENARLLTETREALEQQTATAEVLQVINSSPAELKPVFDAILEKAHSFCGAAYGSLHIGDGEAFRAVAVRGMPEAFADLIRRPFQPGPNHPVRQLIGGAAFATVINSPDYDDPIIQSAQKLAGMRTGLFVPLRKENALLGYIVASRPKVRPFSDREIALLQNFAAQAVIAMENARLIAETREALEQQTATAEVLQVINSSPGDLAPVFDAMLEKALQLCEAPYGILWNYDGEFFEVAAQRGVPKAFLDTMSGLQRPTSPETTRGRLVAGEHVVHITNLGADLLYQSGDQHRRALVDAAGAQVVVAVSLRKDDKLLGAFTIYRQEARPFTDKQIALVTTFADQAVIAIENARLLTETREALEQQTATAEVLQVINSSPGDLAPVFDAILEKAHALCRADHGHLTAYEAGQFRALATHGVPEVFARLLRQPFRPGLDVARRLRAGESVIQFTDMANYSYDADDQIGRSAAELAGARTLLIVALRKDDNLFGYISAHRTEVRPFSEKEIALLQNFAAQAVIAMENARLITETREALEQQTATAEVLQVINSSPGDLRPVFNAILEKAHALCEASFGALMTYDGEQFQPVAVQGAPARFREFIRRGIHPKKGDPFELIVGGAPLAHIHDLSEVAAQYPNDPLPRAAVELGGIRTLLIVPLRKDGALLGVITAYRQEVRPFTDKQIRLLQNFAAQAVIAMENARLLTETREALEQQTATAEVLQVINGSAGNPAPVFDTILEKAQNLCGVFRGSLELYDGENFRAVATHGLDDGFAEELRKGYRAADNPATWPLIKGQRFTHILDKSQHDFPFMRRAEAVGSAGTLLCVALRSDDRLLGMIAAARREVQPFSDKQIRLLQNFAAQAVIAMENARLLGELRARTDDLQESLDYQTAISDVLKVISRSAFDLQTVLQAVVTTAVRLCRADSATIYRNEGGEYCWAAGHMLSPEYERIERAVRIRPGTGTLVGRAVLEGRTVQLLDAWTDPLYEAKDDARAGGVHTMIGVPLLRENAPVGVIGLARRRIEAFSQREIALVTTFADQAVIAIENARLIEELRDRTADLGRSVEELKMLGKVGQAVSSTLDLKAVLSTILTASLGVTMANAGAVFRYIRAERAFRLVEAAGWDETLQQSIGDLPVSEVQTAMGEATARRTPIHIADLAARPSAPLRDAALAAGFHSALIVPLVGAERVFGAITLMRHEAGEFPPETVRLMQTLASQSVLAIQNARLFREIADKSEQLALASQHKSQFLANMSHELRTPLNAILGYAELLVDGIYGVLPEKAQGVLERVQNNGKHLLALINDVLDLAKIEAGQLTLTLENYLLPEVVRSVVVATEPLAAAKGLKFTATIEDNMPRAHGDARRVSQVLLNLVGNAIKFTDQGEVEIRAKSEKSQFVLTVRDTGPGIADADQERIFGEFQQIDNSDTRKKGGTGLGLAISKRMVEMQGGMISVESVLGRGSTFRVVLPVHVEPALEEAAE